MAVLRLVYVATAFLQDNLAESLMLFTWYYKEKNTSWNFAHFPIIDMYTRCIENPTFHKMIY